MNGSTSSSSRAADADFATRADDPELLLRHDVSGLPSLGRSETDCDHRREFHRPYDFLSPGVLLYAVDADALSREVAWHEHGRVRVDHFEYSGVGKVEPAGSRMGDPQIARMNFRRLRWQPKRRVSTRRQPRAALQLFTFGNHRAHLFSHGYDRPGMLFSSRGASLRKDHSCAELNLEVLQIERQVSQFALPQLGLSIDEILQLRPRVGA